MISDTYRQLLARYSAASPQWGAGGMRHRARVLELIDRFGCRTVLDYGCGRGTLGNSIMGRDRQHRAIDVEWFDYEPARGLLALPATADLVVCTHVLEHVEPLLLGETIAELGRLARRAVFVAVPHGPAKAVLPNGRNAHLTQESAEAWAVRLSAIGPVEILEATRRDTHYLVAK